MKKRRVPGRTDRVVVVGAGLGGLSAALRLAGAGREVTVLERGAAPGGRAGSLTVAGFTFDTGPTVLTMPGLIEDALACVGENLPDWLDLLPLSPAYRAHYADGSTLDVHADVEAMAAEVARVCGAAEAAGYRAFVAFVAELFRRQYTDFIDSHADLPGVLRPNLARLVAMGGFRRLSSRVGEFFADERLRRVFSFQAMYAGVPPDRALALYAVIAYMDTVAGVYYPRGGVHAVPRALAGAAEKHGVTFRYGTEVVAVETRGGRAEAVVTAAGERFTADAFVLNPDLPAAYGDLLPARHTPRRLRRLRSSPSCVVWHVGGARAYDHLAHHNLLFGEQWDEVFADVMDRKVPMRDPSLLVTNPTRSDPAAAPAGAQTYYVLAPAPHLGGATDWRARGRAYRDHLAATLEARGLTGFGGAVVAEHLVTPADWLDQGLAMGTPFSGAHTLLQTGPFRPGNRVRGLDNVVLAGCGTRPGVGVPMVLLSGRLAAERIIGPVR
ncbi:MAG TPA: phytoene desaturase family protein [Yinghuangia sp.]|uniref:phytoene desaturase family protein n=1 Tax=Yinghuangia sp. YIM S10712 TaxID=3436930 RepID=UPI002B950B4A|nr:phytoene desaturase family protein [Yinghuangia sp.]